MKTLKKILFSSISGIILFFIVIFIFYPPKYVYRVLVWQDASYDDFKKFKFNLIEKADVPYDFINGTLQQKAKVISEFEEIDGINSFEEFLERNQTYAFLVIRNDTLLFEEYFNNQSKEQLQTSFSVSKSILSILIGLAIQDGKIESTRVPITEFIPELIDQDVRFKDISIAHLLKMKSGIAYDSEVKFPLLNCDDPLTYYFTDLQRMALNNVRIESAAGKRFKYNNYNAILLGLIIERSTGESVSDFMQKKIWKKIGTSYNASWSTDENGFEKMESGYNARPIDMAKLGRLVLNEGIWNGQALLSQSWLEESTKPYDTLTFNSGQKWGYSYMWWSVLKDSSKYDIFGNGRFGQFLYLSPENNTIIIRHGLESDNYDDDDWTELFQNYISINNR
ncbi:serine hydrolase domain-containing protein [Robiginitalea sp. IMCC43444]|uniref:serine hydrolase domain-containing protein n=1 Tax=Robiginitalea sp. IMCC43444 TaxID=3459121 RepID=UPI00404348B1